MLQSFFATPFGKSHEGEEDSETKWTHTHLVNKHPQQHMSKPLGRNNPVQEPEPRILQKSAINIQEWVRDMIQQ